VIDLLPEQKEIADMGGTMRLGADPVKLHEGTRLRGLYGEAVVYERHRHRYEVNNLLRKRLQAAGLVVCGTSPDERLVEAVELADHPFFVACQFHPELKSRPERPAPLFASFVAAALRRSAEGAGAILQRSAESAAATLQRSAEGAAATGYGRHADGEPADGAPDGAPRGGSRPVSSTSGGQL
jgi:Glutamine amidotransferase class-I